jgi:predicted nucleic acid-binding protein
MATRVADRAFVDTNVLVAATDEQRPDHKASRTVLLDWPGTGVALYASGQVFREYLAVASRPSESNGLGLSRLEAVANVRHLRSRLRLVEETSKVADRLLDLLDLVDCGGKQIHDANVVATMLVHGVDVIVTRNVADFARFSSFVRAIDPRET